MRKGGGKAKGASFERELCKRLSLWLSDGAVEDCLWRSAMSGGRSTVAHAKGKRLADQAGDISAITPLGHSLTSQFMIELKFYRDLNYVGIPVGKGNLVKFWCEAKRQARRYGKEPMLIAKQNQQETLVYLTLKGVQRLNLKASRVIIAPHLGMHGVLLDAFLKYAERPNVQSTDRRHKALETASEVQGKQSLKRL